VRHPENADVQNFIGYSYRNLKNYELAFTHYKRAIELDPRHRGAHEYIGETYLLVRRRGGRRAPPESAARDLPAGLRRR
jgi:tetratricopeptide (TPR) repeat protein